MAVDNLNSGSRGRHWQQRDLLSRIPLFSDLTTQQLGKLAAAATILEVEAHKYLFRAGQQIDQAHVLVSGTVKRSTLLPSETEKVIELAQTPQILGLGEVFAADIYASSCQAMTAVRVVAIKATQLRTIVRLDRELAWHILQALAQRQNATEFDTTGHSHGSTGTQRVLDFLLGLSGGRPGLAGETTVELTTSKKVIASRVGMKPESLSRSLRQLIDTGVIVVEGRNVHIQHAALLDTEVGNQHQRVSFSRKAKTSEEGAGKRLSPGMLINLCGRPRVLSQRMATNWALIGQNVTTAKAETRLRQLKVQFERTLSILSNLGCPPGFAERFDAVSKLWVDYQQLLGESVPGLTSALQVLERSERILEAIDRMVGEAERLANLPATRSVNIAGRNRMLSQRIAKFFVFRAWGLSDEFISQKLGDSLCEFDVNLVRLKNSAMGVPELAAQLEEVASQLQIFRSAVLVEPVHQSGTRHFTRVLSEGERLYRHADTVVKLYERLAK